MALTLALGSVWCCAAHNVEGTITCDGQGVAGIPVSDGYNVVLTDASGHYAISTTKKNGYVFYSLPGGYEPKMTDGFMPQFWAPLTSSDEAVNETHNFVLRRVNNDRHIMVFGADVHLARRNSDRAYVKKGLIADLKQEVLDAGDTPIYSVLLGDLTWDVFWTQNDYNLSHFVSDMKSWQYPMPLWPVIGNHDHDPSVPASDETDFDSAAPWREIMAPTYYSFNLGKVHYVVLDDIKYLNEAQVGADYSEGVVGSRNYRGVITADQVEWLRRDLELVDNATPVVVCLHIPAWSISSSTFGSYARLDNTYWLCSLLSRFDNAHIVSGHTHSNYTVHPVSYPNITEHNLAAVCGTLWWTAWLTGKHVCQDGSAAGYSLWTADGNKLRWKYKSIASGNDQLRIYDMNTVSNFYRTNGTMHSILATYPSRVNYSDIEANTVMVNVFAYDTDWQVSICEGDSLLRCQRVSTEDPYHTITYDLPQWNAVGYYTADFATNRSTHIFKAVASTATKPITVRVVDSFGNVYLRSISRPHAYSVGMEKNETTLVPGDVNVDGEVTIADANLLVNIILSGSMQGNVPLIVDCNADNEISIADLNCLIQLILNP